MSEGVTPLLAGLLERCAAEGASDLHVTAGLAPRLRLDGALVTAGEPTSTAAVEAILAGLFNPAQRSAFAAEPSRRCGPTRSTCARWCRRPR